MKRDHLYVKRSHPLVCFSVLCMLASAIFAVMIGFKGWGWITAASIGYALIVLLSGDELLHRSAVPVWVFGIWFAAESSCVLCWIVCSALCICYTVVIAEKSKRCGC